MQRLRAHYGRLPGERQRQLLCDGPGGPDRRLLAGALSEAFLAELARRGYDLATLRFSVCRKEAGDDPEGRDAGPAPAGAPSPSPAPATPSSPSSPSSPTAGDLAEENARLRRHLEIRERQVLAAVALAEQGRDGGAAFLVLAGSDVADVIRVPVTSATRLDPPHRRLLPLDEVERLGREAPQDWEAAREQAGRGQEVTP